MGCVITECSCLAPITNEFSLYKLLRALSYLQKARKAEQARNIEKAEENYNGAVTEVTEGIVSSRVGLDWLPETLLMAAYFYEKLATTNSASDKPDPKAVESARNAAKNIYRQMLVFYKGTSWATLATKKLGAVP